MRRIRPLLVGLPLLVLLTFPTVCLGMDQRASEPVYGHPWAGSYLHKVPSSLTVTHSRTVLARPGFYVG